MANNTTVSGGVSGCTIIFIVFLLLKVFDKVDWSWWLVTLPLWGPFALVLGILVVVGTIAGICAIVAKLLD